MGLNNKLEYIYFRSIYLLRQLTPKNIYFEIRSLYMKITKGYNYVELWNLSDTFTNFILPRLKAFKAANRCGYPGNEEDSNTSTPEAWEATIDKMIVAFELIKDDYSSIYNKYKDKIEHKEKSGLMLRFGPLPAEYIKEMQEAQDKIEEGLSLFSRYFQHLWD